MESDIETLLEMVSHRLREIRLKRDLSQEDFDTSEPKGISVPTMRSLEGLKKKNIELRTLFRFCRRAEIHPKELFNFNMPWETKSVSKSKLKKKRATRKANNR